MPTSAESRKERIRQVSVEDIEDTYRKGYLTSGQRNKLVQEKARNSVEHVLEDKGYLGAIFAQTMKHLQDGWDNLKESALREPTMKPGTELYNVGLAIWGEIQILTSALNAVGEVTGQVAENMALKAGASPGLARVINIATDVGTGIIPVGVAARGFVTGVRAIGKTGKAQAAAKAIGAQEKAAGAVKQATAIMAEGLSKESPEAAQALLRQAETRVITSTAETLPKEAAAQMEKTAAALAQAQTIPGTAQIAAGAAGIRGAVSVREGYVRLYRGEAKNPVGDYFEPPQFKGQWFTKDRSIAEEYAKEGGTLKYIDVPEKDLGKYVVERNADAIKYSLNPTEEYVLGEVASSAKTIPSVAEQFAQDLTKFKAEMEVLTTPQSHEQTARLAAKLGLDLEDLKHIVPGQALDEKQMFAYLKALKPPADKLVTLAEAVVADGTEESLNALMRHTSEFFTIAPTFRGAEVTAGRAVEILKETPPMKQLTNMLMAWDPESLAKGDFRGAMMTFAEDIVGMAETPEKVRALAATSQGLWGRFKETGWPMIRQVYTNLLLARPLTQVRNFAGNTIAAVNAVAERATGAAFSADRKAGLVMSEAVYLPKGMMLAMGDGLKAFGDAFRKMSPDDVSRLDYVPTRLPGVLGRIIQSPGDAMRGMDNFFKAIMERGSYYAQAMREGTHRGLQGDALSGYIARRVNNPTEKMMIEASEFKLAQTFQNELGTLGKKVQGTLQAGPLALYFPFMKTPINLAKYAWNRTPGLQLFSKSLYDDIAAGGVKADLAIGRLTTSNLMGMFLFELAKDGMITGSGPVDPALRRVWLTTHQPYSVKTKDGWIPIANAEPGSTVFGLVGDYAQILNQLDQPSAEQGAMALAFTIMHNLADKTYWQTMSDLVDVASGVALGHEPGKTARTVLLGPVTTVATGGPLGASIARAIDPIRRETRTFMDGLQARIPGYSKDLPPMRDAYGDPILPPQAVGGPWVGIFSPLTVRPLEEDPIKREGDRLGIKVPQFPWSIGGPTRDDFDIRAPFPEDKIGTEVSPQQRDRWQQIYGRLLRHPELGIEKQLLGNSLYQKSTPAMQRESFMDFMADSRSTAREALTIEDVALGKKILTNDAMALLPLLNEQDQAAMKGQLQESLNLFDTLAPEQRANLLRWGVLEPENPEGE